MPSGGRRPGAGKPKGYKHQRTLEKEEARKLITAMVISEIEPITKAQLEHAKGVSYVMLRRADGTYARATDVKQLDAAAAALGKDFGATIFTQAPNVQAYTSLMDRAFGRPTEHTELEISGSIDLRTALARRRKTET